MSGTVASPSGTFASLPPSKSLDDELLVELELDPSDASVSPALPASSSLDDELEAVEDVELDDGCSLELEELSGEASDGPVEVLPQADRAAKCPVTTASAAILNHSRFKACLRWIDR
jgi:hypothetical protein